jgi:hypothetical protein
VVEAEAEELVAEVVAAEVAEVAAAVVVGR